MKDSQLSRVVFDRTLFDTFLSMASQEKLLTEDARKTDAFLSSYQNRDMPSYLKQAVLEQIVLSPEVLTHQFIPIEWLSGELIDRQIIHRVDEPKDDALIQVGKFSPDIISAMLQARGYSIPEAEFENILERGRMALDEEDKYEKTTGKKPPDLQKLRFLKALRLDPVDNYSEADYDAQLKRNQAYDEAKPLLDCMVEYIKIATTAHHQKALVRFPDTRLHNSDDRLLDIPTKDFKSEIALLRVVATKLGKLSFRPTLRESIELSQESNTAALRKKLTQWKEALESGELQGIEQIQQEVHEATSELAKLSTMHNVGRITTYIGVPISLVGNFSIIPAIAGIVISVVGFAAQVYSDTTEAQFRWAMFGNI